MDYCKWATQLGCKVIWYVWRDGNNKKGVMVVDLLGLYDLQGCFTQICLGENCTEAVSV